MRILPRWLAEKFEALRPKTPQPTVTITIDGDSFESSFRRMLDSPDTLKWLRELSRKNRA